jgi:hypothetical protein
MNSESLHMITKTTATASRQGTPRMRLDSFDSATHFPQRFLSFKLPHSCHMRLRRGTKICFKHVKSCPAQSQDIIICQFPCFVSFPNHNAQDLVDVLYERKQHMCQPSRRHPSGLMKEREIASVTLSSSHNFPFFRLIVHKQEAEAVSRKVVPAKAFTSSPRLRPRRHGRGARE